MPGRLQILPNHPLWANWELVRIAEDVVLAGNRRRLRVCYDVGGVLRECGQIIRGTRSSQASSPRESLRVNSPPFPNTTVVFGTISVSIDTLVYSTTKDLTAWEKGFGNEKVIERFVLF